MNTFVRVSFVLFFLFLFGVDVSYASHIPAPSGFVNDFAGMFSSAFRKVIEEDLQNFEQATRAEIVVATVDSLAGESLEDFAVRLFEEWGIGKKSKDNGLLLLIVRDERKVRIEVGYGLEPYITDGRAGTIIRKDIAPYFREEAYEKGVESAISSLKAFIVAREPETPQEKIRANARGVLSFLGSEVGLIGAMLILLYILEFLARSKSFWLGGAMGGSLGAFAGWLFFSFVFLFVFGFIFGVLGFLLDYVLSRNYTKRKAAGLLTGFWVSRGGFSSRGRGGFGGFGGGSSGGGGASGTW
ncbi:MAG: TPM domain-containing protein [Candidatus Portnoybacteria bacterium]|nr:TPM domain-containing protein [Candidatus Portnoybacteria bacterium]